MKYSAFPPLGVSATVRFEASEFSPELLAFAEACQPKYPRAADLALTNRAGDVTNMRVLLFESIGTSIPTLAVHGPRMSDGRWSPIEALPTGTAARLEDPETGRTWALPAHDVRTGGRR